jgi:Arc/MetJ family transcription regulator
MLAALDTPRRSCPVPTNTRTNIVLDEELLAEAMQRTGIKTKRGVVEEALRTLNRLKRQEEIRQLRGALHWEGDLDEMRRD